MVLLSGKGYLESPVRGQAEGSKGLCGPGRCVPGLPTIDVHRAWVNCVLAR